MSIKKNPLLLGVAGAGIAIGIAAGWLLNARFQSNVTISPMQTVTLSTTEKKVLFYRNPMDASITSPVPQKDNMGMDYIAVYEDENSKTESEGRILFYRNPMDPNITSPMPQKDNMGMDYIPVYADKKAAAGVLEIDPRVVQNLGVRTTVVQRQSFATPIDVIGTVAVDERGISFFNPKISGWVERVYVKALGDSVQRGQLLAEIYAPELVNAQEEFLVAMNGVKRFSDSPLSKDSQSLLDTVRERLRLLDMSNADIEALERSGKVRRTVKLYASHHGIITELNMREGGYVTPDIRLYSLADLSRIWVIMEIYANQTDFVKRGDLVILHATHVPGREWRGHIDYLYPTLNPQSRTVQARLVFDNPDNVLRPGMFVNASIQSSPRMQTLAIPREALLRTGMQNVVIVALSEGRFKPVKVRIGTETSKFIEILEGLDVNQRVVLSGQFLLDAEASFTGGLHRLEGGNNDTAADPVPNNHTGHRQ